MTEVELKLLAQMHEEVCDKIGGLSDTLKEHVRKFEEHVQKDAAVHNAVNRHTLYFQGLSVFLSAVWVVFLSWFKPASH